MFFTGDIERDGVIKRGDLSVTPLGEALAYGARGLLRFSNG